MLGPRRFTTLTMISPTDITQVASIQITQRSRIIQNWFLNFFVENIVLYILYPMFILVETTFTSSGTR